MLTSTSLMTPEVITASAHTTVAQAATVMRDEGIGSVFVEKDGRIVGIVTETDIVRRAVAAGRVLDTTSIAAIMSSPVIGIQGDRPLTDAAHLMERHQIRHLAILKGDMIVGILSVRDLLYPVSIDEF